MNNSNIAPPIPSNFMVPAVVSTLCCCLPAGIVAIINAAKVNSLYQAGDYAGAERAAGSAKTWTFVSAGLGIIWIGIVVALQMVGVLAQLAANQ